MRKIKFLRMARRILAGWLLIVLPGTFIALCFSRFGNPDVLETIWVLLSGYCYFGAFFFQPTWGSLLYVIAIMASLAWWVRKPNIFRAFFLLASGLTWIFQQNFWKMLQPEMAIFFLSIISAGAFAQFFWDRIPARYKH